MQRKYVGVSYVYLLVHEELPYIKIGKANDVQERIASLELGYSIVRSSSTSFMIWSEKEALAFEKTLHFLFSDFHCEHPLYVPENGNTEWFSSDCNGLVQDAASAIAFTKGYIEEKMTYFENNKNDRKNRVREMNVPKAPGAPSELTVELLEGRYSWFGEHMPYLDILKIHSM